MSASKALGSCILEESKRYEASSGQMKRMASFSPKVKETVHSKVIITMVLNIQMLTKLAALFFIR
ncbi:hypothetical protein SDC9_118554 [bioreactor metagenome]|uniref:Uncharacterized protein n=1 Tax=bioreactor metagenome TaxID=1076179 RepID=A0A645C197_9ZZZZ